MLNKLIEALKDAKEKAPYHLRYNVRQSTWEVWTILTDVKNNEPIASPLIVNIASHDDAEDMCEEKINEFIIKKLLNVLREPDESIVNAGPPEPYMDKDVWIKMIDAIK